MARYPTKNNVLIVKILKDTLSYHQPNQGDVSVSKIVKLGDTKVSVKTMYLDVTEFHPGLTKTELTPYTQSSFCQAGPGRLAVLLQAVQEG